MVETFGGGFGIIEGCDLAEEEVPLGGGGEAGVWGFATGGMNLYVGCAVAVLVGRMEKVKRVRREGRVCIVVEGFGDHWWGSFLWWVVPVCAWRWRYQITEFLQYSRTKVDPVCCIEHQ